MQPSTIAAPGRTGVPCKVSGEGAAPCGSTSSWWCWPSPSSPSASGSSGPRCSAPTAMATGGTRGRPGRGGATSVTEDREGTRHADPRPTEHHDRARGTSTDMASTSSPRTSPGFDPTLHLNARRPASLRPRRTALLCETKVEVLWTAHDPVVVIAGI